MKHLVALCVYAITSALAFCQMTVTNTGPASSNCIANTGNLSNVTVICKFGSKEEAIKQTKEFNELLRLNREEGVTLDSILSQLKELNASVYGGSFGNLKERAISLAETISKFLNDRDALDPIKHTDPSMTPDDIKQRHLRWVASAEREFAFFYWNDVVKIRDEFAKHNFHDQSLDETIDMFNRQQEEANAELRMQREMPTIPSGLPVPDSRLQWMQIDAIGGSLNKLANELPEMPPSAR
jgi:hypothetical protein